MTRSSFTAISICFFSFHTLSQTIDLGVGVGYAYIVAPSRYVKPITNFGYGFAQSFPLTVSAVYTTADERFSFCASSVYQRLSSKAFRPPHPIVYASPLRPGEVENESAIWSGSFGMQWPLFRSDPTLHLAVGLLLSSFGDVTTTEGTYRGDYQTSNPGRIRAGFSAGAGFTLPIIFKTSISIDAKYVFHSLFGRPRGEESVNSIQLIGTLLFPIWSGI